MEIVVHLSDEDIAEIARGGEVKFATSTQRLLKHDLDKFTGIVVRKKKEVLHED